MYHPFAGYHLVEDLARLHQLAQTQIALFQHADRPPAATVTKQGLADLKVVYLKVRDMKRDVNNKKHVRYATLVLPER